MNGMAGNEDVDAFIDEDFPDISSNEFQRLEQDAITFTQQEHTILKPSKPSSLQKKSRASHIQNLSTSTADRVTRQRNDGRHGWGHLQENPDRILKNSSEGLVLDEDGLPPVIEEQPRFGLKRPLDETAQREQWRVQRFAPPHAHVDADANVKALYQGRSHASKNQASDSRKVSSEQPFQLPHGEQMVRRGVEGDALLARIAELMRERDELTKDLSEAKKELSTKHGEIAVIRAKMREDDITHELRVATLTKLKQEESEKHQVSMQAVKAENASIESERLFLRHELDELSRKAQSYQQQLKERPIADQPNVDTTPKRNQSLRDGFDDDEMMVNSPVKSGRKSKQSTPTANRKRKQPNIAEPVIQPLALRLSGEHAQAEPPKSLAPTEADHVERFVYRDRTTERHLHLVQKVLNLRSAGSSEILLERLFKHSFPSEAKKSFGAIVLDAISKLQGNRLAGDLLQIFIDLWARAMKEQYHICLSLVIEIISHILDQDPFVIDAGVLDSILPVLVSTILINATVRFQLMKKDYLNSPSNAKPTIDPHINNTSCLELLHTISGLISDDSSLVDLFWRRLSTDFVLVALRACQTIPDVVLMLQIMATSILPNTFGMICAAEEQEKYEGYICDHLCYLLWQIPRPDAGQPPYSQKQICLLRQESLNLLTKLTLGSSLNPYDPSTANNHGTMSLVSHPTAIAHLVRSAYNDLAAAYLMTPTQDLHINLLNTAVRILHFVLLSPAGRQVPWQTKVSVSTVPGLSGGGHKFRVVMARLAYATGTEPGIDAGVTEDTIRMAMELLEYVIKPDEVEDVVKVFEGEGSSAAPRTSAIGSTQR